MTASTTDDDDNDDKQQQHALDSNDQEFVMVLPGDNITRYIMMRTVPSSSTTTTLSESPPQLLLSIQQRQQDIIRNDSSSSMIKIGVGVRYDPISNQYYSTKAGRLCHQRRRLGSSGTSSSNNSTSSGKGYYYTDIYSIQSNIMKRYRPMVEDRIIGIIQDRIGIDGSGGDLYRVDIRSSHYAILSNLSFEGASKRNKPTLSAGQLIYARIVSSPASIEQKNHPNDHPQHNNSSSQTLASTSTSWINYDPITLSCCLGPHDIHLSRKDWMTNENAYGDLRGGTLFPVSLSYARELLKPNCLVLQELASSSTSTTSSSALAPIPYEIAIGMNGWIWIHSIRPEYTIYLQNVIQNASVCTPEQIKQMIPQLRYHVEKQIIVMTGES
jgi:exosome complex component RRP40